MYLAVCDDREEDLKTLTVLLDRWQSERGGLALRVRSFHSAAELLDCAEKEHFSLYLLDVMMPGMDGFQTCDAIRKDSNVPVLFLTAKSAENDRVSAYSSGGDDFLSKPFSSVELLAKVSSLLRRYKEYRGKPEEALAVENLEVDFSTHKVTSSGKPVALTDTEYAILAYLLQNRGRTVTAVELYEAVWNEKYLAGSGNTVMVHVLNLRRKIEENSSSPKIVRTVWGKGYQID